MDQRLSVDPENLRATGEQLRQLAEEADQMVSSLRGALSREGACWGDDDPGKTFAQTYVPGADHGVEGLENLAANLHALRAGTAGAADNFENQDAVGGNRIRNDDSAAPVTDLPDAQSPYTATPYNATPGANPAAQATPQADGTDPRSRDRDASNRQPGGPDSNPQSSAAGGPQPPGAGNGAQPSDTTTPDGMSDPAGAAPGYPSATAGQPPAAASPSTAAPDGATADRNRRSSPSPSAAAGRDTAPRTDTPWSRGTPTTPWAKSPASAPAANDNATPPRVSPPQRKGPAAGQPDKKRDDKAAGSRARRKQPVSGRQRSVTDAEALRIAREMAARHGIEITGFETAGISELTVRDIAAALDAVLGKYVVGLRGIEITQRPGLHCAVENRCTTIQSDDIEPWIILGSEVAADPDLLPEFPPAAQSAGPAARPMFAAITRELGGVLDMTGRYRFRREAQRALITEYLRTTDARYEALSRVVDGYRQWRGELGPDCLQHNVFAPDHAMATAFAMVELSGDEAPAPARVLHRMLVSQAGRLDSR
ncbi:hypothetical protein AB0L57_15035 [Nocardia sp. NPDC052254]|uniref:hypothetical protein n=1 Tax=Nocardia sp. NPDC052254 TaxID=3155681 RepID=UPI003446D9DE